MKPIKLVSDPIDRSDANALCEWISQDPIPQVSKGEQTLEFEKEWAKAVNHRYACFCNSGSSANFLMFQALILADMMKNKKVVVPAICWITSVSPIIQLGLQPILCDINMKDLSADLVHLEEIFQKDRPSVFLLVPILGLVPEMDEVVKLCARYGVLLLIDNCESFGSHFQGELLEHYGLMSSSSNYIGHQCVAIEGGMVCTDVEELHDILKMIRSHGWDRDVSEEKKKQLRAKYGTSKFTSLYTFYTIGMNLRSDDIHALIGRRKLATIRESLNKRNQNFHLYRKYLRAEGRQLYSDDSRATTEYLWLPFEQEHSFVSNLGFPIIHKKRDEIAEALRGNNVEVRPLVSGSMGSQPFWIELYGRQHLKNAEMVTEFGMYLPNHDKLTEEEVMYVCDIINRAIG